MATPYFEKLKRQTINEKEGKRKKKKKCFFINEKLKFLLFFMLCP